MTPHVFGILDLLLGFGVVLGLGFWQLHSLKRDVKAREEREERERSTSAPGHPEGKHELDES